MLFFIISELPLPNSMNLAFIIFVSFLYFFRCLMIRLSKKFSLTNEVTSDFFIISNPKL